MRRLDLMTALTSALAGKVTFFFTMDTWGGMCSAQQAQGRAQHQTQAVCCSRPTGSHTSEASGRRSQRLSARADTHSHTHAAPRQ
jgi:hypothetical protein